MSEINPLPDAVGQVSQPPSSLKVTKPGLPARSKANMRIGDRPAVPLTLYPK